MQKTHMVNVTEKNNRSFRGDNTYSITETIVTFGKSLLQEMNMVRDDLVTAKVSENFNCLGSVLVYLESEQVS